MVYLILGFLILLCITLALKPRKKTRSPLTTKAAEVVQAFKEQTLVNDFRNAIV